MNWCKLVAYDLRKGLLRWRYLGSMFIFFVPCMELWMNIRYLDNPGSFMDYMLYLFKGTEPIAKYDGILTQVRMPIVWILSVTGCLFLNLDYLPKELSFSGQNVFVRSNSRKWWYLSKCVWNLCSCALYFFLAVLTAAIAVLMTGANFSLENTPEVSKVVFGAVILEPLNLNSLIGILISFVLPYITVAALSLLEMLLCLRFKPVMSFIICICILVLSVYWDSPFAIGNGAMVIRSEYIANNGLPTMPSLLFPLLVIFVCIAGGITWFKYVDILDLEE